MKTPENCSLRKNIIYEGCQNKLLFVYLILTPYTGAMYLHKKASLKSSLCSLRTFLGCCSGSSSFCYFPFLIHLFPDCSLGSLLSGRILGLDFTLKVATGYCFSFPVTFGLSTLPISQLFSSLCIQGCD